MLRKISFSITFVLTTLLALVAVFNTVTMVKRARTGDSCPTLFGFATAVVISGSMEPTIHVNDLVVIRAQKEYNVDDVVTFRGDGLPVTHRIIGERTDGAGVRYFITQGDNNNTPDRSEITADKIAGKVIRTVPKFGYVQSFLQKPIGFVVLSVALIAALFLPEATCRLATLIKRLRRSDHTES